MNRFHPDFPNEEKTRQYKAHKETSESISATKVTRRCLHWTGLVTGQVALDLAKKIDSLLSPINNVQIAPASGGRGERGGNKKSKVITAKAWVQSWISALSKWDVILQEAFGGHRGCLAVRPAPNQFPGPVREWLKTGARTGSGN